jgi:aminobenzoyl-glutamate utilization protein B
MIAAAKVLALAAVDFFNDHDLITQAKKEFIERTKDNPYQSPLPAQMKPPVVD